MIDLCVLAAPPGKGSRGPAHPARATPTHRERRRAADDVVVRLPYPCQVRRQALYGVVPLQQLRRQRAQAARVGGLAVGAPHAQPALRRSQ